MAGPFGPLIWQGRNAKALTDDILLNNVKFSQILVGNQFSHNSSTGVESGGVLSINGVPGVSVLFDLSAGSGTFIDYTVPTAPTFKSISWSTFTAQTVTGLATQDETYILINNLGAIIQQSNYPTPTQRRTNIFIGRIGHTSRTFINFATSFPDFSQSVSSQVFDLFDALGPFNVSGNQASSNGANLTFQKSSGVVFFRSFNYPTNTYQPHTINLTATVPVTFNYRQRTGGSVGAATTLISPALYDNGTGAPVPVTGGANSATIQRVYLAPNNVVQVQFGQTVYPNLASATASIGTDPFIQNPALTNVTILIAYIVVQQNSASLADPNTAAILRAPKFETGVGGGVNTVISLQQAYNSSVQPQIVLNSTGLGLQIHDNAAPIGTTLFQVANNAGTNFYLRVTAASLFSINVLNIANVSASTSPTTGSITTTGGLGVGGSIFAGSSINSGVAGASLGSLTVSGNTSGTVSILPQAAAGTFNFNLPITAGTAGQALFSGGGGAAPMTWGAVLTNPMTTLGDIIYENATPAPARLAGNITTTINFLSQTGTGAVSAAPIWSTFIAPVVTRFPNAGSTSYSPTVTSGRSPVYIRVKVQGGGGGGGGGGTGTNNPGSAGSLSSFGNVASGTFITAGGGAAGAGGPSQATTGGAGGSPSISAPANAIFLVPGGYGSCATSVGTVAFCVGGLGGNSFFGGAASSGYSQPAAAGINTGAGGAGGGGNNSTANAGGVGGGAGAYCEALLVAPSGTYTVVTGGGGGAGAGSGASASGSSGATGIVVIEEYYQ